MKKNNIKVATRSWESILNDFANSLNIDSIQIIEQNKKNDISDIRKLYCKLRYEVHMVSYQKIGNEIDRVHTTIMHAVSTINCSLELNAPTVVEMWNKVKDIPGEYDQGRRQRLSSIGDPKDSVHEGNRQSENIIIWDRRTAKQLRIGW